MRLLGLIAALVLGAAVPAGAVDVYAAASLTDAVGALGEAFAARTGEPVRVVSGASSTLARQIIAGAPAGVFISANREWMDFVAEQVGWPEPVRFAGNSLVVIGRAGSPRHIDLSLLPAALGDARLALGDPAHVPAGVYARQALIAAGVWDLLEGRVAPTDDVRAAVALVASGAAPFGIVYATDARFPGVAPVLAIDPGLHDPVIYWMALGPGADAADAAFFAFLGSDTARTILAAQGFLP